MVTPGDASARSTDTSADVSASICDAEASDPSDLRRARLSITASPRLGWHTYERRLAELPVHASGYGCWERRMREIRTSGATRGGALSPPTLPPLRLCDFFPSSPVSSQPKASSDTGRRVYSVTALTQEIKLNLERTFYNLWVAGEISNLKQPSSGHYYFTLKDDQSQISAVLFRGSTRHLRFRPQDGMAVLVWGHVTVYEPRGAYQIRVERMEPRGKGSLQLAFEQLKDKLGKEGLFETSRKRPIPLLPQRLGIVTSPSGAALRDLCRILHRRFPNLEVLVYPAQVQGDLAAAEITKGIQVLNRLARDAAIDVLIVARGGGSLEDLWPFNEESVARAIATSAIPVMSAVGHEVDFTIADFVADVRAPTPSAAAELVTRNKSELQAGLQAMAQRLERAMRHRVEGFRSRLDACQQRRVLKDPWAPLRAMQQRLDEVNARLERSMRGRLRIASEAVERADAAIGHLSPLAR